MHGSSYRKVDLHIHTTASSDFKEPEATPMQFVEAALDAGLAAVAITDHNTTAGILQIQEAAKGTELVIFPGIEITTRNGHVLAIFDPETPIETLNDVLTLCGIGSADRGREDLTGNDIHTVIDTIARSGGISVGAHADDHKGFLTANAQGQTRIGIFKNPSLSAVEFKQSENIERYRTGKVEGYDRMMPSIQGSDAHSLAEIGRRPMLIRMSKVNLLGLKQAFADHSLRVKLPAEAPSRNYPYIESISVNQGFLVGQNYTFNPGYSCLVGGAGSGKSTVIEFLRFGLDQLSSIDHFESDSLEKLEELARVGAQVQIGIVAEGGERLSVTRVFDGNENPIAIRRISDNQILDLNIRHFFPVHAYSQGEAVSISRSASAQLSLLDKHLDLVDFQDSLAKAYSELDEQASGLARLQAVTSNKAMYEQRIAGLNQTIAQATTELSAMQEAQQHETVISHNLWMAEKVYLDSVARSYDEAVASASERFEDMNLDSGRIPLPEIQTPNKELLDQVQGLGQTLDQAREAAKDLLISNIEDARTGFLKKQSEWQRRFTEHEKQYLEIQTRLGEARIDVLNSQLEAMRRKYSDYKSELAKVQAAQATLTKVLSKREELLERARDLRARISTLRDRKARELTELLGRVINIQVVAEGNKQAYEEFIVEAMRGSRAQRDVLHELCNAIPPQMLVQLVRARNIDQINQLSHIGVQWAERLIDKLSAQPETMYQLEAMPTEDLLRISFRTPDGSYKALDKLSTGQKATVIVLLTMVEGKYPIVFDQPEDALYTPFIYSDVVKALREAKDKRQFIFATHNSNIAIAGDLDLGIILEGTSTESTVQSAGGLDDMETQRLMVLHLEGGNEAFKTRRTKLGLE